MLIRIRQVREYGRRIRSVSGAGTVIRVKAEILGHRVIDLPRDLNSNQRFEIADERKDQCHYQ